MIVIVDFGSQTAHLIGRRLKDIGVETTIIEPENTCEEIKKISPSGIVLSGGPSSVYEEGAPTIDKTIFDLGIPILGICYGWQITAYKLGGKVVNSNKEYGPANLKIDLQQPLFDKVDSYSVVWVSHGDTVVKIPDGFQLLAETETVKTAAVANFDKKIFGVQFHPEIEQTVHGIQILKNFAVNVCKITPRKKKIDINAMITKIRNDVKDKKVICAVSGGIDSTVAGVLIAKAIGTQLTPIYVESGLMREGTKEQVRHIFTKYAGIEPLIVEAEDVFLRKLKGKTDGEEKRKTIGKLYIDIFDKEAHKINDVSYLAQGTIYSDVIESKGTKHADKIKSHHNVGGLPEDMKLKLLEPLRDYYKDEVRQIGIELGLPHDIVFVQKFPGPGAAIRIMGEVTRERLHTQRHADAIVLEEIKKAGWYENVFHSFAILTGSFSTAVKGDARQHLEVVALRILQSGDEMTSTWAHLPYDLLQKISSRIVNEVTGVSRVTYDITTKPPATMEWE